MNFELKRFLSRILSFQSLFDRMSKLKNPLEAMNKSTFNFTNLKNQWIVNSKKIWKPLKKKNLKSPTLKRTNFKTVSHPIDASNSKSAISMNKNLSCCRHCIQRRKIARSTEKKTNQKKMEFSSVRSDDFIEFYLFPDINVTNSGVENEDQILDDLNKQVNELANVYCSNYIFHKESFKIQCKNRNENSIHYLIDEENDNVKGNFANIWRLKNSLVTHFVFMQKLSDHTCMDVFILAIILRMNGLLCRCSFIWLRRFLDWWSAP